jgi:hypothetical protein
MRPGRRSLFFTDAVARKENSPFSGSAIGDSFLRGNARDGCLFGSRAGVNGEGFFPTVILIPMGQRKILGDHGNYCSFGQGVFSTDFALAVEKNHA